MKRRKLISQYHPILYFIAVELRRLKRKMEWYFSKEKYASIKDNHLLNYRIKKHQSLLLRKLGDDNMYLQYNKITNLKLAIPHVDNILIRPGEMFSFCKLVGKPTARKGYVMGMELSFGQARPGIGGGICQISNMIHWLVIHSPLTVVQRAQHSFDPFPDEGRVLPFGSGAAIFYNYIDYQFKNTTQDTYQLRIWLTDQHIEGELRVDNEPVNKYHIFEKNHAFLKVQNEYFRQNEIWRKIIDRRTGNEVGEELLTKNYARVTYTPDQFIDTDDNLEPKS